MDIKVEQKQARVPITMIRAVGEFDSASAKEFEIAAQEAIDAGASNILVDLSGVPFMSSAGVRALNGVYYQLHPKKTAEEEKAISKGIRDGTYKAPHMKLLNPTEGVMAVLKMVGMDMYIDIFNHEEDAILAFSPR